MRSVLDDLGEEVTGIMWPVSLCMLITVILVRLLNPDGSAAASNAVVIASVAYNENPTDSSSEKFSGALLNAIIFVGIMAGMTFLLVLLFWLKCYRIIYGYMTFAVFDIFALITAFIAIEVLQVWNIHVDAISFSIGIFNFSVCGTLGLLFMPMPLLAKQWYNIWTGIVTAYIFTWIPEWTSWVLIVVMAIYDILAVLIPGGPLNLLVRLSQERQEGLPALVYEARPTRGRYVADQWVSRRAIAARQQAEAEAAAARERDAAAAAIEEGTVMHDNAAYDTDRTSGQPGSARAGYPPASAGAGDRGSNTRGGAPRGGGGAGAALGEAHAVPLGSAAVTAPALGNKVPTSSGPSGTESPTARSPLLPRPSNASSNGRTSRDAGASPRAVMQMASEPFSARSGSAAVHPVPTGGSTPAVPGSTRRSTGGGAGGGGGQPLGEGVEHDNAGSSWLAMGLLGPRTGPTATRLQGQAVGEGIRDDDVEYAPLPAAAAQRGRPFGQPIGEGVGDAGEFVPLAGGPSSGPGPLNQPASGRQSASGRHSASRGVSASGTTGVTVAGGVTSGAGPHPLTLQPLAGRGPLSDSGSGAPTPSYQAGTSAGAGAGSSQVPQLPMPVKPVQIGGGSGTAAAGAGSSRLRVQTTGNLGGAQDTETNESVNGQPPANGTLQDQQLPPNDQQGPPPQRGQQEEFEIDIPDSIKLGLGDFIFYSMLVGRAAMYDYMTVFASYLGIIAGLGITLLCLAIYQRALPALPFSIALGVLFYFLTRLVLEPYIVPLSSSLTYY